MPTLLMDGPLAPHHQKIKQWVKWSKALYIEGIIFFRKFLSWNKLATTNFILILKLFMLKVPYIGLLIMQCCHREYWKKNFVALHRPLEIALYI